METSTPNARQRRDAPLRGGTPHFTPLKMKGRIAPIDPDILIESNDDLERAERRKSRALRKSILPLPHSTEANRKSGVSAADSPAVNDSVMRLSEAELKIQLNTFCKLNAENKISIKNAWHIRVIDVLKQIVSKNNTDVLKVAGTSLIVAAKVYGLRVDDLHAESLKLASSLGRNFANRNKDDDGNEEETSQTAEEGQKKKSERRKKRTLFHENKKLTIEPDASAFLGSLPKLESNFFSTKTESGLSATDNLSTNKCRMDPSGCRFLFGTNNKVSQWTAGSDKSVNSNKKFPITLKPIKNSMLCAQLKDFQTDYWDPNQEYDDSFKNRSVLEDVVQDENGFPIAEIDGSLHDFFNEPDNQDGDDDGSAVEENAAGLIHQDLEYIVNFVPTESHLNSSVEKYPFSFNDVIDTRLGNIEKMWAGPSHWKLKLLKPRAAMYSGKDGNMQKVPQRKRANKKCEAEHIDMWKLYQEDLNRTGDVPENHKKSSCKKVSVSDPNKTTLPLQDTLCTTVLKNIEYEMTVTTKRSLKKKSDAVECAVTDYNYDNPNDSNYCPEPNADDDNGADCLEMSGSSTSAQAFTGDNLVEAPEMVEQIFTKYATKAKKMNMAKLKEFVWCILTGKEIFDPSAKVGPIHFSKMYSDLPKILPDNMAKELSCHLAFVALLHLCNEHNLQLRKLNGISDFEILRTA